MSWTIRKKLIMAFLGIVLIFFLGGVFILYTVRDTGLQSKRFVAEYWPTTGLVSELRILYDDIAEKVLTPSAEADPAELIASSKQAIHNTRQKLFEASLSDGDIERITVLLEQIENSLALPIEMYSLPGERMEEADAEVDSVLAKVNLLGDTALVNTIWQAVMAFNDILITKNPEELERFTVLVAQIENHSQFHLFEAEYGPFKTKALGVFAAAEELSSAQKVFTDHGKQLVRTLRDLRSDYEQNIVRPAASGIVADLKTVERLIFGVLIVSTIVSLIVGFFMARGIGRPIKKIRSMISSLERGELFHRLNISRTDELGDMARAMDGMAAKLGTMVGAVGDSSVEIIRLSQIVSKTAAAVDAAAQAQATSIKKTADSLGRIRQSGDEVARGINHLGQSAAESGSSILELSTNIDGVAANADTLFQTVDDVSSSIDELASTITQIADSALSLREASDSTSSSIYEMESSINQVEEYARNTQAITMGVGRDAERGKQAVETSVAGMEEIQRASQVVSGVIATLAEKASDIGGILSVIGDITEQTNLLALNAAIIAAQAGEQGKAFGVVSDEIRELADRTRSSTKEITAIISGIQVESSRAVEAIEGAERAILEGQRRSSESSMALEKIVNGLAEVGSQMDRVVHATSEQARGGVQIKLAMEQVSQMIHQIAKATAEQEKGSRQIMTAATTMHDLTGQVSHATREQSIAAKTVARATEHILKMIEHIKLACDGQIEESELIVKEIKEIGIGSEANIDANKQLNRAVEGLAREVDSLEEEMGFFELNS